MGDVYFIARYTAINNALFRDNDGPGTLTAWLSFDDSPQYVPALPANTSPNLLQNPDVYTRLGNP
ncbi:hypothetical protein V5O48_017386 [Marasmius crinis-equi]|uniref:Uncharacterized protein n=1 Tax=Marasmius crinis-equi TaxID=585013 RepID=A0ABR3EP54_9AGAR